MCSGSQLKEIFEKIDKLLSGRTVMSGGKTVCASHHRCGQEFINYKLAEKFVVRIWCLMVEKHTEFVSRDSHDLENQFI